MPPRSAFSPLEIPGQVLRTYRVCTLEDVDRYLRGLKRWLAASIEDRPAQTVEHLRRYNADLDALLDARGQLMALAACV